MGSSSRRRGTRLCPLGCRVSSMTFLVLCPSCRHQVSVQENTAGQLARCPYCARPFKVPAPPPSPAAPPRVQAVAKKPEKGRGVAPRPPMPNPRKGRAPVDDPPPVYSERSGSRGKILLGVLSFGIVGLLLAVVGGVAVFLLKDRLAEPQSTEKQASQVASARKKPAAPVSTPTERTAPHDRRRSRGKKSSAGSRSSCREAIRAEATTGSGETARRRGPGAGTAPEDRRAETGANSEDRDAQTGTAREGRSACEGGERESAVPAESQTHQAGRALEG